MTWFDLLLVVMMLGVVVYEARMETGRALLDTVAVLAALQFSRAFARSLTPVLGTRPLPGTEFSPVALGLAFGILLAGGLFASKYLHRNARWSMDQFDLIFGAALGLVLAVALGHGVMDVVAHFAIQKYGYLPAFFHNSLVADELRSFHTYHYVVDVFHSVQAGRSLP
jgi:hypothetical protein